MSLVWLAKLRNHPARREFARALDVSRPRKRKLAPSSRSIAGLHLMLMKVSVAAPNDESREPNADTSAEQLAGTTPLY
jgi:hypothetical protein